MSDLASPPKIIVTGATSIIGRFLLPRLVDAGYEVHAISRNYRENPDEIDKRMFWYPLDITHPEQLPGVNAQALIHLAPLWLLPPLLPVLSSLRITRVIGFGSTSLFSKIKSADAGEQQLVARFVAAEESITQLGGGLEINWTIFRPTLVYDCVHDKNIAVIARFIQRYGFFPLLGEASGLRQPVHADDLAEACIIALGQPVTFCRAYNVSGGETLSYRQMVERIFNSLGKSARFLIIPAWLFRGAIRVIMLLPGKRNMTPEMAMRMNVDLCFDHTDATRDFGFSPRPFLPRWEDPGK
ncbi:NAD-dependent epimerase/dehydratase family protein [Nitrosospira sp. NpAV]|uniref:NAD(P)H-binding protein n=1 Tax=Nitrosospira sp. NpAV TaxID=58133 RepID=UPI00059F2906|nr:NAD-dependent epimerase/dehydratase family protein [Nitrosospira sp. NpAV]KIO49292.1 NAD-dependent dehydratase [Nitrosospira sp. NpAV]